MIRAGINRLNMNIKAEKNIQDKIKKLPKETGEAINAFDWEKTTGDIGKEYIHDDIGISILEALVGMVLAGIDYAYALPYNIEREIGITEEEAKKIYAELDQKVFKPIYEIMVQKIKAGLKDKKTTWLQNVEFVLSGGDYTVFQEEPEMPEINMKNSAKGELPVNPSAAAQNNQTPKVNTDFISKKDDLRSKFKI